MKPEVSKRIDQAYIARRRNSSESMGSRGKRRERSERRASDNKTEKREGVDKSDLDSGYKSPIASWRDLNPKNLLELLKHSRYLQLLLVLTLVGALLRLYNLSYNSLWLDEAATLDFARHSFAEIWGLVAGGEVNPPLFYWIEHAMLAFGESEFVLRVVPVIAGILTIPVFYFLGREIMDRNAGVVAAALLAFSPFHLFYSQEARAYSLMLLLVSLGFLFFLRSIKTDDYRDWVLFGVFSSLAFWVHFYTIVPVTILMVIALLRSTLVIKEGRLSIKRAIASVVIFILLSMPLFLIIIPIFRQRTAAPPTWGAQGLNLIQGALVQLSGFNAILALIFLILFIAGIFILLISNDKRSRFIVLTIGTLFIFSLIASVVLSGMMPMVPRYMIYLLSFYFPAIAVCAGYLVNTVGLKKVVYGSILLILLACLPFASSYYTSYSKEDWRGFADILSAKTSDSDLVVAAPAYMRLPLDYYYSNASDRTIEFGATNAVELQKIRDDYPEVRMYIVVTGDIHAANPEGDALRWLDANTKLVTRHYGIHLFVTK